MCHKKSASNSPETEKKFSLGPQPGAVLEGFLRFPETTQDFPSTMGAALFGYNVSRGIHSGLNSGINWPLFHLLVKEMQ